MSERIIPPALVAHADQAYASANAVLDSMLADLRADMADRPGTADSLYWVGSMNELSDLLASTGGIKPPLLAMFMAAVYRLARQVDG